MSRFVQSIAFVAFTATLLPAQKPGMAGMHDMHHETSGTVSAAARRQIDSVARAIVPLGTPSAAMNAGFLPMFGWIPTMGVHWVARGQLLNGRRANIATPSQLMFSTIGGRDSLVGAAYGYFTATADTLRPAIFDGAPAWHEHRDLAPMGGTLLMLHVWFVPSPDGPFAGTNPNLPFWALGLAAPDSARMREPQFKARVYRASLALAELTDTSSILAQLAQRPDVRTAVTPHRDSIRALVPEFLAAQKAKDAARWNRTAIKAAVQWDAIYAAYLASTRSPEVKQRIEQYVAMLLGRREH